MKVRFDGLDVQAMVAVLQRTVLGRRVVNIYDGDTSDTYIFKLEGDGNANNSTGTSTTATAGSSSTTTTTTNETPTVSNSSKEFLVLESGVRFHLSTNIDGGGGKQQGPGAGGMPSPFVAKLRKHLRSLRFEKIFQIGTDRVVVFQFGVSQYKHSIILELYAKGNLILVDKDYTILSLLRSHVYQATVDDTKKSITDNGNTSIKNKTNTKETKVDDTSNKNDNKEQSSSAADTSATGTTAAAALVQVGRVYPVSYATSITTDKGSKTGVGNNTNTETSTPSTNVDETQPKSSVPTLSILEMTTGEQLLEWAKIQIQPPPTAVLPVVSQETIDPKKVEREVDKPASGEDCTKNANEQSSAATTTTATTPTTTISKKKGKKQLKNDNKNAAKSGKKDTPISKLSLKNALLKTDSGVSHYGPALIEHCLLSANIQPANKAISAILLESNDDTSVTVWNQILLSLQQEGQHVINALQEASRIETPGYILYKIQQQNQAKADDNENDEADEAKDDEPKEIILYEEFVPHLLKQHESRLNKSYTTFSHAVDEFFSSLAHQKAIVRAKAVETSAATKLEKIRQDQLERIRTLEKEHQKFYDQAKLVQVHSDDVDKAIKVINTALTSGMDWDQLDQLVAYERNEKQNPIALLIHKLDLQNDSIILRLTKVGHIYEDDDDDDDNKENTVDVKVSLLETAHANANLLFAKYRGSKEKWQKTVEASSKALKAAEDATKRQLADAQKRKRVASLMSIGATASNKRVYHWFEKFRWFITSDNYLVVGGRDAQQNELLVKRYLRPGDAYLHADIFGAPSCVLRAKRRRVRTNTNSKDGTAVKTEIVPLSDVALREAGNFAICNSSAWGSKMITSAWWVESHQVSKSAPTGEYLTTGAFMIRGKKNFLPPTPLEMGLGVLFRYNDDDADAAARHKNDRRDFALLGDDDNDDDGILDEINNDGFLANDGTHQKKNENKNTSRVIPKEQNDMLDTNLDEPPLTLDNEGTETNTVMNPKQVQETTEKEIGHSTVEEEKIVLASIKESQVVSESDDDDDDLDNALKGEDTGISNTSVEDTAENDEGKSLLKFSDQSPSELKENPEKKRGLSIRDRKLIKRYGSLEEANRILSTQKESKEDDSDIRSTVSTTDQNSTTTTEAGKLKRGQKGKQKRIQKKYGDQDEEYRQLALQALQGGEKEKSATKKGSSINKKGKTSLLPSAKRQEELAAETTSLLVKDSEVVAMKLHQDVRDVLSECIKVRDNKSDRTFDSTSSIDDAVAGFIVRWDKIDGDTLEQLLSLETIEAQVAAAKRLLNLKQSTRVDNFSGSLGGIIRTIKKYGHEGFEQSDLTGGDGAKRKGRGEKVAVSKQAALADDTGMNDDEEDAVAVDDTLEIRKLTGKPHPDDVLMYCVPVCGPYSSLQQCTYRVKLTPGNMKRGRAAKQCIEMFLKSDVKGKIALSVHQAKQLELIKKAPDTDWVHAICADTKISAANASKVAKAVNSKAKKSKT